MHGPGMSTLCLFRGIAIDTGGTVSCKRILLHYSGYSLSRRCGTRMSRMDRRQHPMPVESPDLRKYMLQNALG